MFSTFVVEQEKPPPAAPTVTAQKNVRKAVVVIVDELGSVTTQAHGIAEAHRGGNVFKSSVTQVTKQTKGGALGAHEDVFATIVVEVTPGSTATKG